MKGTDKRMVFIKGNVMKKYLMGLLGILAMTWAGAISAQECCGINKLTDKEKELGFELLFDGKALSDQIWQGAITGYPVEDGVFVCRQGGQLLTKKDYADFIFRFEFKLPPKGNNGVGIRTPLGQDSAYHGMEIQILSDAFPGAAEWQKHGSIYGVVPAKTGALKPDGEWNQEEIIAVGPHIRVIVNGQTIVDADITDAKPIHGEHPGLHNKSGFIGFLGHGDPVEFRTVRVLAVQNEADVQKVIDAEK